MNNEQLNRTAAMAQHGCEDSLNDILRFLLPEINRMSLQIWYVVASEAEFTQNCIVGIYDAIKVYDPGRGNFSAIIRSKFKEARRRFIVRLKKKRRGYETEPIHHLVDDEGSPIEVIDELALIDDGLLTNEKIALLAEDDSRKLAILNAWSYGLYNDKGTASLLAQRFGGNPESHRKLIIRFRKACRKALA